MSQYHRRAIDYQIYKQVSVQLNQFEKTQNIHFTYSNLCSSFIYMRYEEVLVYL